MITLVQHPPPPNHHHHLQWYSTVLPLYLMCLHPLLKFHLQCSTLTIIIAPQMKNILSQPCQSQLITGQCGLRKLSKNQFKISQIFLSFPHLTLYNLLTLLTWHRTDCPSCSLGWVPLLQFNSSIAFLPTPLWDSLKPTPIHIPGSSIPGSQLLFRSFLTGWQFKFIILEFLLRGTG